MNCLVCGKSIRCYTRRKYCSRDCAVIAKSEYQKTYNPKKTHLKKGIVYKKICLSCGIGFKDTNKNKLYCTVECRRIKEKYKRQQLLITIKAICVTCGRQFQRKHSRSKTCGDPKCYQDFFKERHNISGAEKQARLSVKTVHYRGEKVETKCPMCGILYPRFYNPGWIGNGMPRVMCDKCSVLSTYRYGTDDIMGSYSIRL